MTAQLKTISPVDQSLYVERPLFNESEIDAVTSQARSAQSAWRKVSIADRATFCSKAIDYFLENRDQIAEEICWQMGRPISVCPGEISGLEERSRYLISIAEEALADLTPDAKSGFNRFVRREPLGVVFIVAPWNYPYLTAVNSIIPALMAGNAVILKHSSQTPLCAERFAAAFEHAGLPDGVFQYIHCSHDMASKLIHSRMLDYVAFTGSVRAGAQIEKLIAGQFIGRGLELGGKDPAYVRHDADLEYTVGQLVDGAFFNSGQSCCGIERIYVDNALYAPFLEAYSERVAQYRLGNPTESETTLGPMVNGAVAQSVKEQIDGALYKGAKAHIDASSFIHAKEGSPYMAPQVLSNVTHEMSIMRDETFGPVVGIMSVSSDEEAVKLINDSSYGLTASVWSQDEEVCLRLGPEIQTGTLFMNRCDYLDPALVWTGVKDSGQGNALSHYGYHQLTRVKSYHFKR